MPPNASHIGTGESTALRISARSTPTAHGLGNTGRRRGPAAHAPRTRTDLDNGVRPKGGAMPPTEAVQYRLPDWTITVRCPNPGLFALLDAFHDRRSEDAEGDDPACVGPEVVVVADPQAPLAEAAGAAFDADPAVARAVTCRYDAEVQPRELMFRDVRVLIRDLWQRRLTRRRSAINLHAAAVDDGERVIAFVGDRYRGKTTLLLDTLLRHGGDLLSNDNLVVYRSPQGTMLTTVPTYIKVRAEPARRFAAMLRTRASATTHGAQMWRRYRRDPDLFPFDGEAMLPPAGFGRTRQPVVGLAQRQLVLVDVGFTDGRPELVRWPVSGAEGRAWLGGHAKWRTDAGTGRADADRSTGRLLDDLLRGAHCFRLRHTGSVDLLLEGLPGIAPRPDAAMAR
ncbi:hypothetical protein [Dactylosporangium sp. CA-139066]|uniref:hypothetical protein n=1 Tax=Dactylosporangium sp. CA-139066 TaxID=3239930 RepID=UPI003D92DFB4